MGRVSHSEARGHSSAPFSKQETTAIEFSITSKAVAEALDGLPAYKMHCSVLAEEAIQAALEDYKAKQKKA